MVQRREQAQDRHGVFVEPGISGSVQLDVFAHGKHVLRQEWDREYFDPAWVARLQKWLERRHPRLRVMD